MRTWFRRTICGGLIVAYDSYIDTQASRIVREIFGDDRGEHICGEGI